MYKQNLWTPSGLKQKQLTSSFVILGKLAELSLKLHWIEEFSGTDGSK